jgi:oligopeptide transport system substrate-binding protein
LRPTPIKAKGLALACIAGLGLVACGNGSSTTGTQLAADQTLNFPLLGDFGSLDPGVFDAETDSEIAQNIFSGVVRFDDNLNVVPDLASSMPTVSSDGLTYTFPLRHNATFSNGDKITADDVIYSWTRAAAMQNPYAGNFAPVVGYAAISKNTLTGAALEKALEDGTVKLSGLSKTDDYTVVAKLSAPAGYFLTSLALVSTGWIVDKNVVKNDFDNWWTKPETLIGSGPYKMTAHIPKQSVDFQAVSNWWGANADGNHPAAVVQKIHCEILQNSSTAVAGFQQKKYDIVGYGGWSTLAVQDVKSIQADPKFGSMLKLQPKVRSYWVSFNMWIDGKRQAKGPFATNGPNGAASALALRKAFALAIDKQKVVDVVCQDIVCSPATGGLINKGLKGYLGDGADPLGKFDVQQAQALLKQGDPNNVLTGPKSGLTYVYDPNNPLNASTAQELQSQWKQNLGVTVNIQPVDHSTFIKTRLKGGYVLSRDGWQADYDHPQDWFDNLWGSVAGGSDATTSGYTNPAYDTLLKKADGESLPAALTDYKALAQMLITDAAYIPLYYSVGSFLFEPYVKGAGTNNFFDHYWNELSILQH